MLNFPCPSSLFHGIHFFFSYIWCFDETSFFCIASLHAPNLNQNACCVRFILLNLFLKACLNIKLKNVFCFNISFENAFFSCKPSLNFFFQIDNTNYFWMSFLILVFSLFVYLLFSLISPTLIFIKDKNPPWFFFVVEKDILHGVMIFTIFIQKLSRAHSQMNH